MNVHRLNEDHDHRWERHGRDPRRCWCMAVHPEDRLRKIEIDLPEPFAQEDLRERFFDVVTRDRFFALARKARVEAGNLSILDCSIHAQFSGFVAKVLYRGPAIADATAIE